MRILQCVRGSEVNRFVPGDLFGSVSQDLLPPPTHTYTHTHAHFSRRPAVFAGLLFCVSQVEHVDLRGICDFKSCCPFCRILFLNDYQRVCMCLFVGFWRCHFGSEVQLMYPHMFKPLPMGKFKFKVYFLHKKM